MNLDDDDNRIIYATISMLKMAATSVICSCMLISAMIKLLGCALCTRTMNAQHDINAGLFEDHGTMLEKAENT